MSDAMRERVGLARAGSGNDQQRASDVGAIAGNTVHNRAALLRIEELQIVGVRHPRVQKRDLQAQPDHDLFGSAKRER